jgi:transcription antitermination factor NusG
MDDTAAERWCILRTPGLRTLKLAASLQDAGFDAWTPIEEVRRRVPRCKQTEHVRVAMTPSYVFVRERHLPELRRLEAIRGYRHPAFSVFRYYGATVFVRHGALHALRRLQQDSYLAALPVGPNRSTKPRGAPYDTGDTVKLTTGGLAGLECVVEASDGLMTTLALTLFGRRAGVKVPTGQLRADGVTALAFAA